MTFVLKDIRDHLTNSTAIANEVADRVYADIAPQRTEYPYILLGEVSALPEYHLGGEVGTHTTQVQVDVWTDGTGGRQKANEIGELVRNRLSGYRGQFGTGVYGTSHMTTSHASSEPPPEGSDQHRQRVTMQFELIHSADVPTFA